MTIAIVFLENQIVNKIKTLFSLLLATGLMAFGAAAHADSFTVELSTEFSGAYEPNGSTPWLEATFTDVVDYGGAFGAGVLVSVEATSLTDQEWVSEVYWNYNGSFSSIFGYYPTTNEVGVPTNNCAAQGQDTQKADGAGYFDMMCSFANGQFTGGDTFEVVWTSPSGISASDFDLLSTASDKGQWTVAAHIQSIYDQSCGDSDPDCKSGWIAGNTDEGEVPEPGTLALFGLGLTMMGVVSRRRRIVRKS
jgi:hypothetical protein